MFEAWLMGTNWTQEQWLVVSIIGFVIVAMLVVVYLIGRAHV